MAKIKLLSDDIINQIAAGEIIEKPASALKEIVENSIDANAENISIFIKNGGKSKIVVEDDGSGMSLEDLEMCVKRHATSKLSNSNLFDINSYGFRGEAIPSIASVSKFSIESGGYSVSINFSEQEKIKPSSFESGTKVSVSDIFHKLPVRLKFLKSDSSELSSCISVIENFALIKNNVIFSLRDENKTILSFNDHSIESRVSEIFGKTSLERASFFESSDNNAKITGYLFHPSDSKFTSSNQKIFVNGRIIKDKSISTALKIGYADVLQEKKFPSAVIFIEIDPFFVDVNISPTKSEVRFRDPSQIQKIIISAVKKNIRSFDRNSVSIPEILHTPIKNDPIIPQKSNDKQFNKSNFSFDVDYTSKYDDLNFSNTSKTTTIELKEPEKEIEYSYTHKEIVAEQTNNEENFFGSALCQMFDTYIISKSDDDLFLIDQHAVHEKITLEEIKQKINDNNIQYLAKPEVVEINENICSELNKLKNYISSSGFKIDILKNSVIISGIPAILNIQEAIDFILHATETLSDTLDTMSVIKHKISTIACHNSIRAGKKLSIEEMNSILRKMEHTESIHQCNHNRPAFIKISKKDLDKMFERT